MRLARRGWPDRLAKGGLPAEDGQVVALGARLATPERGSGPGSILLAIVGVAFLAIFFTWLVRSRRRERRAAERERLARAAAVRQAAARLGLEYSENAPAGLPPDSTWS